ncbi:hypothetical protein UFOVP161_11 [uncultured Caudovirales phage]|uniref:Uncharacterized protein n=1 Tax=uncultured Caudovirales phage TaxID=2100421 RepID=A0A6J7WAL3_9CAUD|nr:hypothetical protein UFOVP161_11 [uncultured Caudovirales phage]
MNWAEYVNNVPQTLDERRIEKSVQYKKEKRNEYERKKRASKKVVQQLLEGKTS